MWMRLGRLWGWLEGVAISVEELNRQEFLKEAADLGEVVVGADAQKSNAVPFTLYAFPTITDVSASSGVVGGSVTIASTNLLDGRQAKRHLQRYTGDDHERHQHEYSGQDTGWGHQRAACGRGQRRPVDRPGRLHGELRLDR
jgi:hypothetical protein